MAGSGSLSPRSNHTSTASGPHRRSIPAAWSH